MNKKNERLAGSFLKKDNENPFSFRFHLSFVLFFCIYLNSYAQDATVRGRVKSSSGELLAGVTIQVKNLRIATQTDRDGNYALNSLPLKVTLTFSRLGYKTVSLDLGLISTGENTQDVVLYPEIQSLDEIHITEIFSGSNFKVIEPKKYRNYPSVSGSFESYIKNMPGVSPNNELSVAYSVRGGNPDENLLYLNDIEIYRPQLSSKGQQEGLGFINADLANSVRFSTGGFEARYGDKFSSVLDVRYSRPDSFSLSASTGLMESSAAIKIPLKNSYLLAGIRNKKNKELLDKQNPAGRFNTHFSDYQLLYKQNITPRFNLSFFGNYNRSELNVSPGLRETEFGTSDEVLQLFVNYSGREYTKYDSYLGAITLAYNISNIFNLKLINSINRNNESENTGLMGWYTFDERDGGSSPEKQGSLLGRGSQYDFAENQLISSTASTELRAYAQVNRSFLEFGLRLQQDRFNDVINEFTAVDSTAYSELESGHFIYSDVIDQQSRLNTRRISGFAQNTLSLGPYFTMAAGLRANFNTFTKEVLVSPRFSILYSNNPEIFQIKFSAGSYFQPPWYKDLKTAHGLINKNAKAQRSYQFMGGTDYYFSGLGTALKLTSELYYKTFPRLTPYKTGDLRLRYLADQKSSGYASGADFSLSGNFARELESSFRISYMKTKEDIEDDVFYVSSSGGAPKAVYPGYLRRPHDQRVNFGILFQDRLLQNPTYKVHLTLLFGSSLPTGPAGSQRYEDRFKIPPYKRVDIGFSKDFADSDNKRMIPFVKKYFQSLSAHAEIFNLLNIKNTVSYLWLKDVNDVQYAVPNYLTFRKFNFRVSAILKSK